MDQDFTFRNSPDGPVVQGDASDIGKPLGFLPSGLLGVLAAAAIVATAPLQAAINAAPAGAILAVTPANYVAEGVLTVTKNIALQGIGIDGVNGWTAAGLTVANGLAVGIENASLAGPLTVGAGGVFRAVSSTIANIAGAAALTLERSTVIGTLTTFQINAIDSTIVGNVNVSDVAATFNRCTFAGGVVVTFTGAPGVLALNGGSYQSFISNGGTVVNGRITSNQNSDPTMALTTPQLETAAGAAAYVTLNQDGGEPMSYDATTLAAGEVLDVGIDANETNGTTGVHSQLRANRSYIMTGGVLTQLNDSTAFSPALVGGVTPTLIIDLTANFLSLQGRKEAAGGANHKYTGKLYIRRSTVS